MELVRAGAASNTMDVSWPANSHPLTWLARGLSPRAQRWISFHEEFENLPVSSVTGALQRVCLLRHEMQLLHSTPSWLPASTSEEICRQRGLYECGNLYCPLFEDNGSILGLMPQVDLKVWMNAENGQDERGRFLFFMRDGEPWVIHSFCMDTGDVLVYSNKLEDAVAGGSMEVVRVKKGVGEYLPDFLKGNECCEFCYALARKCECASKMTSKVAAAKQVFPSPEEFLHAWNKGALPNHRFTEWLGHSLSSDSDGDADRSVLSAFTNSGPNATSPTSLLWEYYVHMYRLGVYKQKTRMVRFFFDKMHNSGGAMTSTERVEVVRLARSTLHRSPDCTQLQEKFKALVRSIAVRDPSTWRNSISSASMCSPAVLHLEAGRADSSSSPPPPPPPPSPPQSPPPASTEISPLSPTKEGRESSATNSHSKQKKPRSAEGRPQCKTCGMYFARNYELNRHVSNIHEATRNFRCTQCLSTFKRKSQLLLHVSTVHEKNRNFPCNLCKALFPTKQKVDRHRRAVHDHERDHRCELCKSSYFQGYDLRRHMLRSHGISNA